MCVCKIQLEELCFTISLMLFSYFTFATVNPSCTTNVVPNSSSRLLAAAVVFDGLLTHGDASAMSDYVQNCEGFYVFDRSDIKQASRIEQFLDQTLSTLGDESRWIEYWVGREWLSHPMHRDVDERMCFEQAINRFPRYGHVLYLSHDEHVTGGQTVVLGEGEDETVLNGYKRRSYEHPPVRTLPYYALSTLPIINP